MGRICPHAEIKNNAGETVCLLQDRDVCNCIDVENYEDDKDLQHFKDTVIGLWATDRPDLLCAKDKEMMFKIK